ncbi:MAG: hypothetical protein WC979_09130 [Candidatus Pacearchaeota archaeon]|jgi:hypothetical protein
MKDLKYIRGELMESVLFVFVGIFTSIVIPIGIGLSLRGFEESFILGSSLEFGAYLTSFLTYLGFIVTALGIVLFNISSTLTLRKGENAVTTPYPKNPPKLYTFGRLLSVDYIYAPEKYGMLYKIGEYFNPKKNFMRWSLNPLRMFVVSIIAFGIYGLFLIGNPQLSVSGVPQLQLQQVTLISEIAFGSLVPAFAENGLLLFVLMTLMGIPAYICAKKIRNQYGYPAFFAMGFLISILMGFFWGSLHTIVYGNSDASFWATVIFGIGGSLLTILFGNFIPWYVWHVINNAFISLSIAISSKEDLFIITLIGLFFITVVWVGIELFNRKRIKKKQQYSIEGT